MPARGTGGEPINPDRAAAAASTGSSSNMDPQTGLSRVLSLLLFLHLMPPGGHSHPLGGPSPGPHLQLSRVQVSRAGLHKGIRTGYWAAETSTEVTLRTRKWREWEPGPCTQGVGSLGHHGGRLGSGEGS